MDNTLMERNAQAGANSIRAAEHGPFVGELRHTFLTGDPSHPCPHPFFRNARLEILVCEYEPGDHGCFQWHDGITEYEFALKRSLACQESATGKQHTIGVGDLLTEPCRTLTIKLPFGSGRIQCRHCLGEFQHRVREFGEEAA